MLRLPDSQVFAAPVTPEMLPDYHQVCAAHAGCPGDWLLLRSCCGIRAPQVCDSQQPCPALALPATGITYRHPAAMQGSAARCISAVLTAAPRLLQVVTQPMDLGTVQQKLGAGEYASAQAMARDIQLVSRQAGWVWHACKRGGWASCRWRDAPYMRP